MAGRVKGRCVMLLQKFLIEYNQYWHEGNVGYEGLASRLGISVHYAYNLTGRIRKLEKESGKRLLLGKLTNASQIERMVPNGDSARS